MSDELSAMNVADDLKQVLETDDARRWEIVMPAPLEIWISMRSVVTPEERFQARLLWSRYPVDAPSLKFRDPVTGRLDLSTAWPKVQGFRPESLDACVNWCIEGFGLHPEWKNDPNFRWDSRGNVVLKVLRVMQTEFDEHFSGRFRP